MTKAEQLAPVAYALYRHQHPDAPEWERIPNQHKWIDCMATFLIHPYAHPSGGMEECVRAVIEAEGKPIIINELPKIGPVKPKPVKK